MTIITSDTHREFRHFSAFCNKYNTTKDDLLIVLGDAGINYYGGENDAKLKRELSMLPITLFCIHGNHEQRPESLGIYNEMEWRGGIAYIEHDFPNLIFAKDGEIYDIDGKKCIAIGGAYSIDKEIRLKGNGCWWPDEQPSDEIKRRVEQRLDKENWAVDVVFSHTAPLRYEPRDAFLPEFETAKIDNSTEIWLDSIECRLAYSQWYCGHYHINRIIDRIRFVYQDFVEFRLMRDLISDTMINERRARSVKE